MLKLLACLFMLIDHIAVYFQPVLPPWVCIMMRCAGRLAFPIFAWSVARGCARARNPVIYFTRMSLFAIITEILLRFINRLPGVPEYPVNVMITFALAIVLVFGYQLITRSTRDMIASLRPISPTHNTVPTAPRYDVRINLGGIELDSRVGFILGLLAILLAVAGVVWLQPDYTFYGLATVLLFFIIQERFPDKDWFTVAFIGFFLLNLLFVLLEIIAGGYNMGGRIMQCLSIAALPLCCLPALDKKPGRVLKYFFYVFYPLHILILALLNYFLLQN